MKLITAFRISLLVGIFVIYISLETAVKFAASLLLGEESVGLSEESKIR